MEPHAIPAAARGQKPCPHPAHAITETDSRTDTEHKASNTSEHHKHLKSLVLGYEAVYFEPWAWQALRWCVHDMTNGQTGQDKANAQIVCAVGLLPSGTLPQTGESPGNFDDWISYQTQRGPVYMNMLNV